MSSQKQAECFGLVAVQGHWQTVVASPAGNNNAAVQASCSPHWRRLTTRQKSCFEPFLISMSCQQLDLMMVWDKSKREFPGGNNCSYQIPWQHIWHVLSFFFSSPHSKPLTSVCCCICSLKTPGSSIQRYCISPNFLFWFQSGPKSLSLSVDGRHLRPFVSLWLFQSQARFPYIRCISFGNTQQMQIVLSMTESWTWKNKKGTLLWTSPSCSLSHSHSLFKVSSLSP